LGTFNKSTAYQGSKIMRVPLPEIGRLWTLYISCVRPLVTVWQTYFRGRVAGKRADNSLFFGLNRPVSSAQLSQALAHHTSRILHIRITISLWRHIATWFLNYHAVKFQEHLAMANRSTLAVQMGHSEATHALYASDARLPSGIDFHVFFASMKTSGIWHELIGFPPNLSGAMNAPRGLPQACGEKVVVPTTSSPVQLVEQIRASLTADILRTINLTRASDLAALLNEIGVKPQPRGTPADRDDSVAVSPTRLIDLRRLLGDPQARFKSSQQAIVSEVLASGEPSLLIIGPTGLSSIFKTDVRCA
jgi:hypothetical protein